MRGPSRGSHLLMSLDKAPPTERVNPGFIFFFLICFKHTGLPSFRLTCHSLQHLSLVSETCPLTQTWTSSDWDRQIGVATLFCSFSHYLSSMVLFWNEDAEGFLSYSTVHSTSGLACWCTLRLRDFLVNEMWMLLICEETKVRILGIWFS